MPSGWALVTGASAGIGRELAREFAAGGYDLVAVARREERLRELADELDDAHGTAVEIVTMDLARPNAVADLESAVNELDVEIRALVNNAGIGSYGRFHATDPERERDQVQLNVVTLMEATRRFLPAMVERDDGKVLNVGSLAGFQPGPRMAGYYASKAYVNSFSEAIAEELRGTGVDVTVLCPGPVHTEFQERADMEDSTVGGTFSHSVEDVARAGYRGVHRGKPVVIPGLSMKLLYLASRLSPRFLLRRGVHWINSDR